MKKVFGLLMIAVTTSGISLAVTQHKTAKGPTHSAPQKGDSLYHRLGEKKAITLVVDQFVMNCIKDPRISSFFKETTADKKRLAKFKEHLVTQICEAAGGPCTYIGKDMRTTHSGMGIKGEHFDALVENLTKALDKFHVNEENKIALLNVLGPMKDAIIEEHSAVAPSTKENKTD